MQDREQAELPTDAGADSPGQAGQELWQRWRQKQGPTLQEVLARAGELTAAQLAVALGAEQHQHWQEGKRTPAEAYLQQYPVLSTDEEAACDLVYGEFLLCEELGEAPSLQAYLERFPRLADGIKQLHQCAQFNSVLHCLPLEGATQPEDPANPAAPSSGPNIIGYEILRELGRGGMGVVYHARHIQLNRVVALKMILPGSSAGDKERARFRTEAEAVARLQHPNIVQIHEIGEHDGLPYLSLEYCGGGSLAAKLKGTPLPPREAAQLVETLARAMQVAHAQQIVHRDLKPANVLLTAEGTPKITDFGLAKKLDDGSGHTLPGAILGTPSYMAPEQAGKERAAIGPAADVYALRAILYELLTGRPPFKAATPLDTVLQVVSDEPVSPSGLNSKLPRDLETICLKCLRKEPTKRYASALALAEDLRRYQAGEPIAARRAGISERIVKWVRRRPMVAALLAAVFVVTLAGVGGFAWAFDQAAEARERELFLDMETKAKEQAEQREVAEKNLRVEAEIAHGKVAQQEKLTQAALYLHTIALAHREWKNNNVRRMDELLESCPKGLRNWEWHYLKRLGDPQLPTLSGHSGRVIGVAYSQNGKRLASAGTDKSVKVWDLAKRQEAFTLKGHTRPIFCLAFSADGSRLASAAMDFFVAGAPNPWEIKLWDLKTREEVLALQGHKEYLGNIAFTSDGKHLAAAGYGGTLKVWETSTGKKTISQEKGRFGGSHPTALNADGKYWASNIGDSLGSGRGEGMEVSEVLSGRAAFSLKMGSFPHWGVHGVALSADGNRLATNSNRDDSISIWDSASGRINFVFKGHNTSLAAMVFSPDGERLVAVGTDGVLKVWELQTGQATISRGFSFIIDGLAFSPDGKQLALGCSDKTVRLCDLDKDPESHIFSRSGHGHVIFSPDGKRLISMESRISMETKGWKPQVDLAIRDVATGQVDLAIPTGSDSIECISLSSDGARIATGVRADPFEMKPNAEVNVWDTRTGMCLLTRKQQRGDVTAVAFSPDGKHLASAANPAYSSGMPSEVTIWDSETGNETLVMKGRPIGVSTLAFSPDGKTIVTGGEFIPKNSRKVMGEVKVWSTATGQELVNLNKVPGRVYQVAYSHDGKRLACACADGTVIVWDLKDSQKTLTLKGHSDLVSSISFSPDDSRLASASQDRSIRIWDTLTGQEVLAFTGHRRGMTWLAFSPDGKQLAANVGGVRIWDGSPLAITAPRQVERRGRLVHPEFFDPTPPDLGKFAK
jgi:WD40 repeat protein